MAGFGIPYMGSKNTIAKQICSLFPPATNFYDLFGGGFSITHCMLERRSKDFKHFHFNELRENICDLIKDAISGKYNYDRFKPEWVDRETFFKNKEKDPYIKMCWSFGNNGEAYLFGKDIEQYKKSMHNAIVFNRFDKTAKEVFGIEAFAEGYSIQQRRLFLLNKIVWRNNNREKKPKRGEIKQLQRLEQLERLQQLKFYNMDYKKVPILENSIIYCDPPYHGTVGYDKNINFNHKEFLDWADKQTNPVFISEYNISDPRFTLVKTIKKRSMLCSNKDKCVPKIEKVYVNKIGLRKVLGKT